MKLNALRKEPNIRFDWSRRSLMDVARWANRHVWRYADFNEYQRGMKASTPDARQMEAFN